jgi:predicted RNA-binding protein YlqC (UPF0109 family)
MATFRRHPAAAENGFRPREGELVEVQVVESEDGQPFWRVAEVRRQREGLIFVRYGGPRGTRHDSVDARRVRPSYGLTPALPPLDKREIEVPRGAGPLSPEDYDRICSKSGVTLMTEFQDRQVVVAIGTPKSVMLAEMLLELALRNSKSVRELKGQAEAARQSLPEFACKYHAVFTVPLRLLGNVIGKGGETLKRVKAEAEGGVSDIDIDKESGEVSIHGNDEDAVETARAELEFTERTIKLEEEDVAPLIGKGGSNINALKQSTNLLEIDVIGKKSNVRPPGGRGAGGRGRGRSRRGGRDGAAVNT